LHKNAVAKEACRLPQAVQEFSCVQIKNGKTAPASEQDAPDAALKGSGLLSRRKTDKVNQTKFRFPDGNRNF